MTRDELRGRIQTVLGPIEPGQLGRTLMHEHVVLVDPEIELNQISPWRDEVGIPAPLDGKCNTVTSWDRLGEQDVVYVVGLPDGAVPLDRRADLQATGERVAAQPPSCIILSPLPVIDEMDAGARRDPRNRMFEQSDLALFVRMALLEHVVRESR